ncbi:hypothetical protein SAMN06295937_100791 [Sphingopyxis flava]|uniref:Uncharacterized protein n=1 Tax=Sphingopyxis flava TaxID=1507287 RepID=A0A1T5BRW9_9SPHN|nr:hypothetical protein SAMN06295937_100791 [Sphingopyxis flava]
MEILVIGQDDAATCPVCGKRLDVCDRPISHDAGGPVYAGTCPEHGAFNWQVEEEE